jgi:diguanylate cyclase (GGDEF)-like protein
MSDLVVDDDGRLRRALLTIATEDEQIKAGLATRLALMYLQQENIYPQELTGKRQPLQLGKTLFQRLEKNDGGYVNIDDGGYQILFNFRGPADAFETVSLSEILQGQLSAEQVQDRIVLIGTVAPSINDLFYTSHSGSHRVPGVVVHAQIVSQILEAALDGQPLLRVAPDPIEWAWLLSWTTLGAVAVKALLHWRSHQLGKLEMPAGILLLQCCLAGASYLLFWQGLWLPVVAPLVSMLAASVVTLMLQNQQLYGLATFDGLTRVANRRSFDQHLKQVLQQQKELSLVLCDVDYFKRYNDTYGHQAGDSCLQQVAQALRSGVRKSDLVARYGGEEFALILPHASAAVAQEVIQRIQTHIERLSIPHAGSEVNPYVTISYGIAHTSGHPNPLPSELIQQADDALYQAKRAGRNRAVVVSMAES